MPVPVSLHRSTSAHQHQIHKPRFEASDYFATRSKHSVGNGPKCVSHSQEPVRPALLDSRTLIRHELSHCIGDTLNSAIHLVESQHPSKTADAQHGLTPAADVDSGQQVHAEACSSPARATVRSIMTIFTLNRGSSDMAWSGYDALDGMHEIGYAPGVKGWGPPRLNNGNGAFGYGDESSYLPSCDSMDHDYGYDMAQQASTPFADFVDKMVATDANEHAMLDHQQALVVSPAVQHRPAVPTEPLSNPAYIKAYRSMSEPLSNWIATYIWKACASDVGLAQRFGDNFRPDISQSPSTVLIKSINTVLCSTLLQPSAIFLALWYISRLPVHFEDQLGAELTPTQTAFRAALFGELPALPPVERQNALRRRAPFRIALLGFMLANKWLDDHTFSNKTWQSVSEEPMQAINQLEFAALAVLKHDLSVSPKAWEAWLFHLQHYQVTQSPYPSPIGRPLAMDANGLARKMIADLMHLQKQRMSPAPLVVPVFSSLLLCESEKELSPPSSFDPFDIDLDEDGPLKEEYVPKRRTSLMTSSNSSDRHPLSLDLKDMSTPLPPPSEWSPQGDPLVMSELRGRSASISRTAPGHGRSFSAFAHPPSWNAQFDSAPAKGSMYPGFPSQAKITSAWPPFSHTRPTLANGIPTYPPPYGAHAQPLAWAVPVDTVYVPMHGCGRVMDQPPPYSHLVGETHTFRPLWLRT